MGFCFTPLPQLFILLDVTVVKATVQGAQEWTGLFATAGVDITFHCWILIGTDTPPAHSFLNGESGSASSEGKVKDGDMQWTRVRARLCVRDARGKSGIISGDPDRLSACRHPIGNAVGMNKCPETIVPQ